MILTLGVILFYIDYSLTYFISRLLYQVTKVRIFFEITKLRTTDYGLQTKDYGKTSQTHF